MQLNPHLGFNLVKLRADLATRPTSELFPSTCSTEASRSCEKTEQKSKGIHRSLPVWPFQSPFSSVLPVLSFPSDLLLCSWSFGCREQLVPAWQAQRLNGIWASPLSLMGTENLSKPPTHPIPASGGWSFLSNTLKVPVGIPCKTLARNHARPSVINTSSTVLYISLYFKTGHFKGFCPTAQFNTLSFPSNK